MSSKNVRIADFVFGKSSEGGARYQLRCYVRKLLDETVNFRLTLQCEVDELFESLRGFGGGWMSTSSSSGSSSGVAEDPNATGEIRYESHRIESDVNKGKAREDEYRIGSTSSTDGEKPDLLGLDVWPAALELCEYLARYPEIVVNKKVIELGAGVGLPGLLAAKIGASHVTLTDYEQSVVDQSLRNAKLCGVDLRCSGLLLDWRRFENIPTCHVGSYSIILAADVLYIEDLMPYFVESAIKLLEPINGILLTAHQSRRALVMTEYGPEMKNDDVAFQKFQNICSAKGLKIRVLGERESPGFPGPMYIFAAALDADNLLGLHEAFST